MTEQEREAFEREMQKVDEWGHKNLRRDGDGYYMNSWTAVMWEVWQARAALAANVPTHEESSVDEASPEATPAQAQQAELECDRCAMPPEMHDHTHWCDNQSFRPTSCVAPAQAQQAEDRK